MHSNSTDSGSSITDNLPIETQGGGGHVPPPPVASATPTLSKTGRKNTELEQKASYAVPHWDYATLKVPNVFIPSLLSALSNSLNTTFVSSTPPRHYTDFLLSPVGVTLKWGRSRTDYAILTLPGGALGSLPVDQQCLLLLRLDEIGVKAIRMDSNIDWHPSDVLDDITPRDLNDLIDSGDIRPAYFKKKKWVSGADGDTLYLGNRTGPGNFARIYNRHLDEFLKRFTRFELEQKGHYAQLCFETYVNAAKEGSEALGAAISGVVLGHISFRDCVEVNPSRDSDCLFWQRFRESVAAVPLRFEYRRKVPRLANTLEHFEYQWSRFLAKARKAMGVLKLRSFLERCLEKGDSRLTPLDYSEIQEYTSQPAFIDCSRTGRRLITPQYLTVPWTEQVQDAINQSIHRAFAPSH